MGRTKRKRTKRKQFERALNVNNNPTTVNLSRWLAHNNWYNETCLTLRNFPVTGRGVTSSRRIKENDILITVPYELMITYSTLWQSLEGVISPASHVLKIHDLLAIFLMIEKQKEKSAWKGYIDSLPLELPLLPWLAVSAEINLYPADLKIMSEKNRKNFMESMSRAKRSIYHADGCVLDENLFKWGYVLVNTRAVYVDPEVAAAGHGSGNLLIDQPSMALCPFLDMFNHHFLAQTEAKVRQKEGRLVYQLETLTKYGSYEQIFISYGAHDNVKLLMEYGFFMPGNTFDVVQLDLKILLDIFGTSLDQRRYKFIMQHNFNCDLYVGFNGLSFNLKAVLFICFYGHCQNFSSVIFSDTYPEDFSQNLVRWTTELLDYMAKVFESDYKKLRDCEFVKSANAVILQNFLQYRTLFVKDLRSKLYT